MSILFAWCGHNLSIVNVTHNENLQNNLMMDTNYTKHCVDLFPYTYIHNMYKIGVIILPIHMGWRAIYQHGREDKPPTVQTWA